MTQNYMALASKAFKEQRVNPLRHVAVSSQQSTRSSLNHERRLGNQKSHQSVKQATKSSSIPFTSDKDRRVFNRGLYSQRKLAERSSLSAPDLLSQYRRYPSDSDIYYVLTDIDNHHASASQVLNHQKTHRRTSLSSGKFKEARSNLSLRKHNSHKKKS